MGESRAYAKAGLDGGMWDTLVALVEHGPLEDGDVPSKRGRDALIEKSLAAKVILQGKEAGQAATFYGRDVYCEVLGVSNLEEGLAMRAVQRALRAMHQK